MRRGAAGLFSCLVVAGCTAAPGAGGSAVPSGPVPVVAGSRAPSQLPGGCGATPLRMGALPAWTGSAHPPDLPAVVSHEGNLAGVLFGYPLLAPPAQTGRANKVLWIVREPRNGSALVLTLRPEGGGDAVTVSAPAGSSPGEIYPSAVDIPAPGCWQVVAEWDGHRATLELSYQPPVTRSAPDMPLRGREPIQHRVTVSMASDNPPQAATRGGRLPTPQTLDQPFDGDGLHELRAAVAEHAAALGVGARHAEDLLVIAGELAGNAIRWGGGGGRLRLWRAGATIGCQVSDAGPGLADPRGVGRQPPPAVATGGRGLWIVRQLSDAVDIRCRPDGTTVIAVIDLS